MMDRLLVACGSSMDGVFTTAVASLRIKIQYTSADFEISRDEEGIRQEVH